MPHESTTQWLSFEWLHIKTLPMVQKVRTMLINLMFNYGRETDTECHCLIDPTKCSVLFPVFTGKVQRIHLMIQEQFSSNWTR